MRELLKEKDQRKFGLFTLNLLSTVCRMSVAALQGADAREANARHFDKIRRTQVTNSYFGGVFCWCVRVRTLWLEKTASVDVAEEDLLAVLMLIKADPSATLIISFGTVTSSAQNTGGGISGPLIGGFNLSRYIPHLLKIFEPEIFENTVTRPACLMCLNGVNQSVCCSGTLLTERVQRKFALLHDFRCTPPSRDTASPVASPPERRIVGFEMAVFISQRKKT